MSAGWLVVFEELLFILPISSQGQNLRDAAEDEILYLQQIALCQWMERNGVSQKIDFQDLNLLRLKVRPLSQDSQPIYLSLSGIAAGIAVAHFPIDDSGVTVFKEEEIEHH